ncbi:MAG TPA: hypothetical protein VKB86_09550, partial [Pyrinomonadaceae bacterium]|nr:hypothetical protein [Pyrinomonadaceae bacterium]
MRDEVKLESNVASSFHSSLRPHPSALTSFPHPSSLRSSLPFYGMWLLAHSLALALSAYSCT